MKIELTREDVDTIKSCLHIVREEMMSTKIIKECEALAKEYQDKINDIIVKIDQQI